jgi:hypothetical protein
MILLLSTSDTDLLAAQSSGANYRCANPSRVRVADLPALLVDVKLVVVRLLGGRATWPQGLASVLGSGVPTVVLGGESSPDAALMATSTVPAGIAQEALSYLVEGGPRTWVSWLPSCPTRCCAPARVSSRRSRCPRSACVPEHRCPPRTGVRGSESSTTERMSCPAIPHSSMTWSPRSEHCHVPLRAACRWCRW